MQALNEKHIEHAKKGHDAVLHASVNGNIVGLFTLSNCSIIVSIRM